MGRFSSIRGTHPPTRGRRRNRRRAGFRFRFRFTSSHRRRDASNVDADGRHIATGETARRENCERTEFLSSASTRALLSERKRFVERNTRNTRGSVSRSRNRASRRNVCEVPDGGRDADDGARESDDERDARKNGRGGTDDDGVARCDVERRARWRENGVRRCQERRASRARARDADPRRTTPVGFGRRGDV